MPSQKFSVWKFIYLLLYTKTIHIAITIIHNVHVSIMLCLEYHSCKIVQYQYKVRIKQLLKPSKNITTETTKQH